MGNPYFQEESLRQVETLIRRGLLEDAESKCRELLRLVPNTSDAWAYLGIIALQSKKIQDAEGAFRAAVDLNSSDSGSWHHLSIALHEQGRSSEAEECSRKALSLSGSEAPFWLQLGNVLFAQERFAEAAAAFQNSVSGDPLNPAAWNNYGAAHHIQKHWAEALRAYESSLALEPRQCDTRMKLADVLERMHLFSSAERVAEKLADDFPDVPDVWSLLGRVQLSLAKQDEAVTALRRAIDKQPSASRHSRLLQALQYQDGVDPRVLIDEHRKWARSNADGLRSNVPRGKTRDGLRLGFVSSRLGSQSSGAHGSASFRSPRQAMLLHYMLFR